MYLTQSLPPASLGPLFWAWRGCRCRGPAEFAVLVSGNGQVVIPSAGSRLQGRPQHRSQLQIHSVNQLYSNTLDSILKNRDITLLTKVHLVKAMVFPIVMYGCENWTIKKAERQRIDAFELWCWRRLVGPLDCKESQPVHPKGDQSWVFIRRTDAEAETPILWPPHAKS